MISDEKQKKVLLLRSSGKTLDEVAPKYVEDTLVHLSKYRAKIKKAEDKFNIAFSEKDKDKIMNILYPNKTEEPGRSRAEAGKARKEASRWESRS